VIICSGFIIWQLIVLDNGQRIILDKIQDAAVALMEIIEEEKP